MFVEWWMITHMIVCCFVAAAEFQHLSTNLHGRSSASKHKQTGGVQAVVRSP